MLDFIRNARKNWLHINIVHKRRSSYVVADSLAKKGLVRESFGLVVNLHVVFGFIHGFLMFFGLNSSYSTCVKGLEYGPYSFMSM